MKPIRCYVSPAGSNKISAWYDALLPQERADADEFIKNMRKTLERKMPNYRPSLRGYQGLGELRWVSEKKQHRLIGYLQGGTFYALVGCTHKQQIYDPAESLETANKRRQQIERGDARTVLMISKLIRKLRDPRYRKAFVASQMNVGIPFQVHALMKARGWTQAQLGERAGMLQPRVSAILKPGKTRPNLETLRRLAEAFDCGLSIQFVPFSELVRRSERFDPENFDIPSFDEELSRGLLDEAKQGPVRINQAAPRHVGLK